MVEDSADSLMAVIGGVIASSVRTTWIRRVAAGCSFYLRIYSKRSNRFYDGSSCKCSRRYRGRQSMLHRVLHPGSLQQSQHFTFLLFNLLDSPCLAAIATMAQQMQSKKWFWFAILFQNIFAYIVCLIVYQVGSFVTGGAFGIGTAVGFIFLIALLFMLFRPDPYKNQKSIFKTFRTERIRIVFVRKLDAERYPAFCYNGS